jgi:hypothetical protein
MCLYFTDIEDLQSAQHGGKHCASTGAAPGASLR